MRTQRQNILNHLRKRKTITPMEALNLFGSFRLAARIRELRQQGHNIKTHLVRNKDEAYANYIYLGGKND